MGIYKSKQERLASGRCCWHCRYFIRQPTDFMLDGPLGNICTIDHQGEIYPDLDLYTPGVKPANPDDVCDRFKFDQPPGSGND